MISSEPKVSIVVNSFNPSGDPRIRAMTEFVVRCYRAFTPSPHELLLIDSQAEPDARLKEVCNELNYVHVNLGRSLSFAEGYNTGLRLARAPWIAICANDIFVTAGWFEALLKAAETTEAWMTAPYLSYSDYPAQQRQYVFSRRTYAPNFLTLNLNLLSRRCLETVGLLDERFSGCFNDADYILRIRAAGGKIAITDCGEIVHLGSATLTRNGALTMYERDRPLFEAKWPGLWHAETLRLRIDAKWFRLLLSAGGILPSRWREKYHHLLFRLEPALFGKKSTGVLQPLPASSHPSRAPFK